MLLITLKSRGTWSDTKIKYQTSCIIFQHSSSVTNKVSHTENMRHSGLLQVLEFYCGIISYIPTLNNLFTQFSINGFSVLNQMFLSITSFFSFFPCYSAHLVWLPSIVAGLSPGGGYSQSVIDPDHETFLQKPSVPDRNET